MLIKIIHFLELQCPVHYILKYFICFKSFYQLNKMYVLFNLGKVLLVRWRTYSLLLLRLINIYLFQQKDFENNKHLEQIIRFYIFTN